MGLAHLIEEQKRDQRTYGKGYGTELKMVGLREIASPYAGPAPSSSVTHLREGG
jgi:hypothetical protein